MIQTIANTPITLTSLIRDYAVYNLWANKQLVYWLTAKQPEILDQPVPSSFPSLRQTLVHIWDVERFWLSVLQQVPAPPSFRQHGFDGTLNEVFTGVIEQSEEIVQYIKSLHDDDLQEYVSFHTPFVEGTQPRIEFFHHCMTHSVYHRGQLVTIGRNVGLTDAPMTDYSFYVLKVKSAKKFHCQEC